MSDLSKQDSPAAAQRVRWFRVLDSGELPEGRVKAVTCDRRITTAVKYGMNITHVNITHVLLNNDELGKISKEQRSGNWDVWQTALHNPNFAEYANLCGALGIRVEGRSELKGALRRALDHDGPATVEVIADALLV